MAEPSKKRLDEMFERYKRNEITFNREVVEAIALVQKQLFIRYGSTQKPCYLHSVSLTNAKVMAQMSPQDLETITNTDTVFVNYCFGKSKTNPKSVTFLAPYRLARLNPAMKIDSDRYLVALENSTRPNDELIRILGTFIGYRIAKAKRQDPRIMIDSQSSEVIGLKSSDSSITIDNQKKSCVVLDLSLSGAKTLLTAKEPPVSKEAVLTLPMVDPDEVLEIPCTILRYDIEAEEGTVTLGLAFQRDSIPPEYTGRIERQMKSAGSTAAGSISPRDKEKREMKEQIEKLISMLQSQKLWKSDTAVLKRTLEGLNILKRSLDA